MAGVISGNNAAGTATIPYVANTDGSMNVKGVAGAFPVQSTMVNQGKQASDTITMAAGADAHDALDVVSTAAGAILSFASLGAIGDLICILGARMKYSANAVPLGGTGYRLHLYNASPTAIADDAAFNVPATDQAKYMGYISISALVDVGDTCIVVENNVNFTCKLAGTGIFGILQCMAAETPAANAVFTIILNSVAV